MNLTKDSEEGAVQSGSIGNSRIGENQGVNRSERRPYNQDTHQHTSPVTIELLHEQRCNKLGANSLSPGYYTDNAQAEEEIDRQYGEDGGDQGPRDSARRIDDFVSEIANTVVTEVAIHNVKGRRSQSQEETGTEGESIVWKRHGQSWFEIE